jgi:uncharacterized membrane protein
MKSAARLLGHPIHPMLIPYPFAFLSGAAAFDIAAATRRNDGLAQTAAHLRLAGIASALVAALPGFVDYATRVPAGPPRRAATTHMLSNLGALGCFAAAAWTTRGRPNASTLGLQVVGTALLSLGGWLGGELVYHHQIAVDPEVFPVLPSGQMTTEAY